jgi:tol-pal system protein YbgF
MYKYFFSLFFLIFTFNAYGLESNLSLNQQLERLQREVSDLSETLYKYSKNENSNTKKQIKSPSNLSAFDLRLYDIEKDIKLLNQNYEEVIFQIDDLKNLYEKLMININSQIINNISNQDKKISNDIETNEINEDNQEQSLGNITINSVDLSYQEENIELKESSIDETDKASTPEEEFQLAQDFLRNQKFSEARDAFKIFINNYSDNRLSGLAHYWLGEIYIIKKEYRESALILAEGYQQFPESIRAPDMLYKLAHSLISINKINDGCNTLRKLIKEFSSHKLSNKAKSKIESLECNVSTE